MNIEIEIKLRLPDELVEIRRKLRECGFRAHKRRHFEANTLFDNIKRTLRKNGKLLRVRRANGSGLLTLKGRSEAGRYKKRWEIETVFQDGDTMESILTHVGYHPVFRYEKYRTEYMAQSGSGKVLLDETPIGNFLELEGTPAWIDRTARLLGFAHSDYISRSYGYLYLAYCRERRIRPKNMVFKNRP